MTELKSVLRGWVGVVRNECYVLEELDSDDFCWCSDSYATSLIKRM
jgi:hypothetical protein